MRRRRRLSLIVGLLVTILVAGTLVAKNEAPKVWTKSYVLKALQKSQQQGTQAVLSTLKEEEARATAFEVRIKDLKGEGLEALNRDIRGMALAGTLKTNKTMSKMAARLALNQGNLKLVSANGYIEGSKIGFGIPEWFEGYLILNTDTLLEDYNEADFKVFSGIPLEQEEYDSLMKFWDNRAQYRVEHKMLGELKESLKTFVTHLDFKYIGTEVIEGSVESQSCDSFEVIYDQSQAEEDIKEGLTKLINDHSLEEWKALTQTIEKLNQNKEVAEVISSLKQKWQKVIGDQEQIQEFINQLEIGEIKTQISINDKQEIVKIIHDMAIIDTGEIIDISLVYTLDHAYSEKNMTFNMSISKGKDTQINFKSQGVINASNNKNFELNIKDAELGLVKGLKEVTLQLSGLYRTCIIKEKDISLPQSEEKNLLKMSQEELRELEKIGYEKINNIVSGTSF